VSESHRTQSSTGAVALSVRLCTLIGVEAPEKDLAYINVAAAAQEAVRRSATEAESIEPMLGLAESTLEDADGELRDLVAVGLFEDMQNALLRGAGSPDAIAGLLGPRSTRAWSALERWWGGRPECLGRSLVTTPRDMGACPDVIRAGQCRC
jgi:hypothetical protein